MARSDGKQKEALALCLGVRLVRAIALGVKGTQKGKSHPMPCGAWARAHGRVHLAESPLRWPSVSSHVLGCKTTTTKGDEDVWTRVPQGRAGGRGRAWTPPAALLHGEQPPPGPTLLLPRHEGVTAPCPGVTCTPKLLWERVRLNSRRERE